MAEFIDKATMAVRAPFRRLADKAPSNSWPMSCLPLFHTTKKSKGRFGGICDTIRWKLFTVYRRLFTLVFVANFLALVILGATNLHNEDPISKTALSNAAALNLLFSILLRNEHIINLLFILSCSLPHTAPLCVRKRLAKIYTYGGVHSSCGIAACMWYVAFAICQTTAQRSIGPDLASASIMVSYLVIALLVLIITFSHPSCRQKLHNWFEATHRFAGWMIVVLYWLQICLTALQESSDSGYAYGMGRSLITSVPFWCAICISILLAYPWLRLRRHKVLWEPLSSHAVRVRFDGNCDRYCTGLKLATNPLRENHAFAVIPDCASGAKSISMIISNAGDWTQRVIEQPPEFLWTRGVAQYGALYAARAFTRIVLVTTGSGIGPCLSLFRGRPQLAVHLIWSTPQPKVTYGEKLVNDVQAASSSALIIDTRLQGRPDLTMLASDLFRKTHAEAVFVISNQRVTEEVVLQLEKRGIAAFAPVFDS